MIPIFLLKKGTPSAIPVTLSLFAYPHPAEPEIKTYRVLLEWGDDRCIFLRLDIGDVDESLSPVFEPGDSCIEVTTICEGLVQWDHHHGHYSRFPEPLDSYLFILASLTLLQGNATEVSTGTLVVPGRKSTLDVPGDIVMLLEVMLQPLGSVSKMQVPKKKKKKALAKKAAKKK